MRWPKHYLNSSVFPLRKYNYGNCSVDRKSKEETKISDPDYQTVLALWPRPRLYAEV